jgi:hypothetical protein
MDWDWQMLLPPLILKGLGQMNEFISYRPEKASEIDALRKAGHID